MESAAGYASAVFILTTFAAVAVLLQAAKAGDLQTPAGRLFIFALPLWIVLQSVLSIGGFYQSTDVMPPRMLVFGVLPALAFIVFYFVFFRSFIDRLPLRLLTLVHVVRIPVEIVLYWLAHSALVPRIMTFEGWNFDIVSGILAIPVLIFGFRDREAGGWLLIVYNIVGLILLITIVTIAVMSLSTPFQQLAFDQPNRAVLLFPFAFLPTIVVPIVLFSHVAALYKTLRGRTY